MAFTLFQSSNLIKSFISGTSILNNGVIVRGNSAEKSRLWIFVIFLIIAGIAGGYILLSGGNGGTDDGGNGEGGNGGGTITSIDFRLQGFEAGMLGGDIQYRAEGIGTQTPNLRIDQSNGEEALLFNGAENTYYAYTGDYYIKIPYSQAAPYSGLGEWIREYAREGEGTYEVTYNEFKVKVTINAVNPDLEDSLFSPPENADIEIFENNYE